MCKQRPSQSRCDLCEEKLTRNAGKAVKAAHLFFISLKTFLACLSGRPSGAGAASLESSRRLSRAAMLSGVST
jgi:hypothetical protein